MVLHGERDGDNLVGTTEDKDEPFDGPYERAVLPGVGHFPPREAPAATAQAMLRLAGEMTAVRR
ncbi:alpha/beta hydrolase [Streptomyces justiciae]|uniref:Alpha/beta hydrolase n=1 Tax=Streptomyces justiciae TaxID=2780140 RepID=A0ABU3M7H4_9ACTN|nr:alpha/beta hydrolase [Streptomyces justiciae]MDT7847476.1 alpha/beta hydrolase [Streptomyces justiciae]